MTKVRDIIQLVQRDGWEPVRTRDSYRQYRHPEKLGTVTIPGHPGDDVAPGTYLNMLRQAGLRERNR